MRTIHIFHLIIAGVIFLLCILTIETPGPSYHHHYHSDCRDIKISAPTANTALADLSPTVATRNITPQVIHTETGKPVLKNETGSTGNREHETQVLTNAFDYSLGQAQLSGEPGALQQKTDLKITGLSDQEMASLNQGMVNVTGEYTAYRMLPHGTRFNKDISIVLPYDTTLLPPGFTPYDIMTYYYHEEHATWIAIHRDSVDMENQLVYSRVNHFTDFINAIIKTPEMPETQAYVPTTLSDIPVADPMAALPVLQAPVANNKGTAIVNVPIEIPQGRQGIQPELMVTYNSGNGNGWMGLGWDLPIPVITVDNRWGVPYFDSSKESELYLLNGEQLATKNAQGDYNPLTHRAEWVNRKNGNVRFYPRTEGEFQQITRHGTSPKNYWWEIRDKMGKIYYYGKKLGVNSFDPNAVLRDAYGNIAKWGLTEIRDLNDNFAYFTYDESMIGKATGKSLLIKEISYTGHGTTPGKYKILFAKTKRAHLRFTDIFTNYRYGFNEINDDLLTKIISTYNDTIIRVYKFHYDKSDDPAPKAILRAITDASRTTRSIAELLEDKDPYKPNKPGITPLPALASFDFSPNHDTTQAAPLVDNLVQTFASSPDPEFCLYYFESYGSNRPGFKSAQTINTGNDPDAKGLVSPLVHARASSLGGTASGGWGGGGALSVGFGYNPSNKGLTAGGNFNHTGSKTEGILTLIDIDGDGLPDKVFRHKKNKKLYYRKQIVNGNSVSFSDPIEITGLGANQFLRDESKDNSFGGELHLTVYGFGASGGLNGGNSSTSSDIFFSDVDGDGLPDIVENGKVYFNRLKADGKVGFHLNTSKTVLAGGSCGGTIYQDVGVDSSIFIPGNISVTDHWVHVSGDPEVNMIRNGDFEEGNVHFYSGFKYVDTLKSSIRNTYTLTNRCNLISPENYSGNILIFNFNSVFFSTPFWSQTVPVRPHTNYNFQANGIAAGEEALEVGDSGKFVIALFINKSLVKISLILNPNPLMSPDGFKWQNIFSEWHSGEDTTACIELLNFTPIYDFPILFLDDIFFAPSTRVPDTSYLVHDTLVIPSFARFLPNHDAVKMWIAPYSGVVNIDAGVCLSEDLMEVRRLTPALDGAKVSVQHNDLLLASDTILPESGRSCFNPELHAIPVQKGDRLYFRLESLKSRLYDKAVSHPKITYISYNGSPTDTSLTDADGRKIFVFDAREDFLINGMYKYRMPLDSTGEVKIENTFSINEPLSADITMQIYHNGNIVHAKEFQKGRFLRTPYEYDTIIHVKQEDSIWFEVAGKSNVKWDAINWDAKYYYVQSDMPGIELFDDATDTTGVPIVCNDRVIPHLTTYPKPVLPTHVETPDTPLSFSSASITIDGANSGDSATFSIKNSQGVYIEERGMIEDGTLQLNFSSVKTLQKDAVYYFDLYLDNSSSADPVTNAECTLSGNTIPLGVHARHVDTLIIFGALFNNWGQFTYKKDSVDGDIIDQGKLYLPVDKMEFPMEAFDELDTSNMDNVTAQIDNTEFYNPLDDNFLRMEADYRNKRWVGYTDLTYISADTISNYYSDATEVDETIFPVPVTTTNSLTVSVKKGSFTRSNSKNVSLNTPVGGPGWNWNSGVVVTTSEYMDMNGDGYPDAIGSNNVQYSKPRGGLSNLKKGHIFHGEEGFEKSSYEGKGNCFSASFPLPKRNVGIGKNKTQVEIGGNSGISASQGENTDNASYIWIDLNGDGLPDKAYQNGEVVFNCGYSYDASRSMQGLRENVRKGSSISGGGSVSALGSLEKVIPGIRETNLFETSISGGYGVNTNTNISEIMFIDMNGDGFADKVYKQNGSVYVSYNTGSQFLSGVLLTGGDPFKTVSVSGSINGAVSFGFSLGIFPVKIVINPQISKNNSINQTQTQFMDLNGDGFPDYVTSNDVSELHVSYHKGGHNLLQKYYCFTKDDVADVEIKYELTKSDYNSPQRSWVMSEVIDNRLGGKRTVFEYDSAYYDRFEKESLGFATVRSIEYINASTVYRVQTEKYHNKEYMRKGLKHYELLSGDKAGNQKQVEKIYNYSLKEIATGTEINGSKAFCYGEGYPALNEEIVKYYQGSSTVQITTKKSYTHGTFGNIVAYRNWGDINDDSDDIYGSIQYLQGPDNLNLKGIPVEIAVEDEETNRLRYRSCQVNENTGKTTSITIQTALDGTTSTYNLEYDIYGNISKLTHPETRSKQRMFYRYDYDTATRSYPVKITNAAHYTSYAAYDYRFGKPVMTRDIGGSEIHYKYDYLGRLTEVKGPKDTSYTIRCYYWFDDPHFYTFEHDGWFSKTEYNGAPSVVSFADRRGVVVQTKKVGRVNGHKQYIVSGKQELDILGRVIKEYLPVTEPFDPDMEFVFNTGQDQYFTAFRYDLLDRQTRITHPDNSMTNMTYTFENDLSGKKRFCMNIKDAKNNNTKQYTDARGLQTQITAPYDTRTRFRYNALGELLKTIDPENIETTYEYDMAGRVVSRVHPDAGVEIFRYDPAGNMIEKELQNIPGEEVRSRKIEYYYHFNMLRQVRYPDNPFNNLSYHYGNELSGHNAGRLTMVTQAAGVQVFDYGPLGEVIRNSRTFTLPGEPLYYSFTSLFEYDSWNRMKKIRYPDGEEVFYEYDDGGNLARVNGVKNGVSRDYITSRSYDKFGQLKREIIDWSRTEYDYDIMQRLSKVSSYLPESGFLFQNLTYQYDVVGNITKISNNTMPVQAGILLSGSYEDNYQYDNLYRLTAASGVFDNGIDTASYSLNMTYSPNGKILRKVLATTSLEQSEDDYIKERVSYANNYLYQNSTQPNTLTAINNDEAIPSHAFSWDVNGNMLTKEEKGKTNQLFWTEENRLWAFRDPSTVGLYLYDADGERSYKVHGFRQFHNVDGVEKEYAMLNHATLYVSPYLVATNQGYTKHYYAGEQRVASSIGGGGIEAIASALNLPVTGRVALTGQFNRNTRDLPPKIREDLEMEGLNFCSNLSPLYRYEAVIEEDEPLFHYHGDHIGSTSWVSNEDNMPVQFFRYLPFGENHINQRLGEFDARYTFSGKEKDQETGFSYFGARYYDSDLSIWLSVDPLAGKYPSLSPYVYCGNNPIRFVDPDGMAFGDPPKEKKQMSPVLKGVLTTAGGVTSTALGVGLCLVPTGASQVAGAGLIATGIPSIGLGVVQIYDGATNDGQANVPGGVIEAVGQGVDHATKNENGTFAKAGEFLDILSGGKPQGAADAVVTGGKLLMMGLEENNTSNNNTQNTSTSSGTKTNGDVRFIPVENSQSKVPPADVKNQY